MRTIKFFICFLILLSALSACSSIQKEPAWLGKTWQDGKSFFFSGISGECYSLQEAKEQAYINALTKVSEYVGVYINTKTIKILSNDIVSIDSSTDLSSENIFLTQAFIKEFKYVKSGKLFTGYILIEYNNNLLENEKKRRADLEKEKQAKIEKRKKIGIITVNILNSSIYNLDGEIKHFLHDEGYFTGTNGIPLTFKLITEQISKSKQNIFICKIKIDICFRNEVKSYSSTGYGNDKRQAVNDAHTQWVKIFKENFQLD